MKIELNPAPDSLIQVAQEYYNRKISKLGFPPRYSLSRDSLAGEFYALPFSDGQMMFYAEDQAIVRDLSSVQVQFSYFTAPPNTKLVKRFKAAFACVASSCLFQAESFYPAAGEFARCLGGADTHYQQVKMIASLSDVLELGRITLPPEVKVRNFVITEDERNYLSFYNTHLAGSMGNIPAGIEFMGNMLSRPSFDPNGYFIAEHRGQYAGIAAIEVDPWATGDTQFAYIYQIGVGSEYKGTGLARHLLKAMLDYAASKGASLTAISVRRSNLPAVSLCKKFGMNEAYTTAGYEVHF